MPCAAASADPPSSPAMPAIACSSRPWRTSEKSRCRRGAKLPDEEIETLRAWIDKGAEWPQQSIQLKGADWWAFHKPLRPAVPKVAGAPIDAFVLERLRAAGVEPTPEADRLTLLHRACFDLH